jgi:hypothetical protein
LLFPRLTDESGGDGLRELASDEAGVRLRRALFGAGAGKTVSDLFWFADDPGAPDEDSLADVAGALARRIPCLECRLGRRSYENRSLAAACLRLLTE